MLPKHCDTGEALLASDSNSTARAKLLFSTKNESVILSLLALIGVIGLLYVGQCKSVQCNQIAQKSLIWQQEVSMIDVDQ